MRLIPPHAATPRLQTLTDLMAESFADGADRGRVDQRGKLFDVVDEKIEVESLIPILELLQVPASERFLQQ
jgi:hypothetical protein